MEQAFEIGRKAAFPSRNAALVAVLVALEVLIGLSAAALPYYLVAVALLMVAAVIVSLIRMEYTVYPIYFFALIAIFSITWDKPWNMTDALQLPYHLFLLFALAVWMVGRAAGILDRRDRTALDASVFLVIAFASVSLLWVESVKHSLFQLSLLYLNALAFYLVTAFVQTEQRLRAMVRFMLYMAFLMTALGILSLLVAGSLTGIPKLELYNDIVVYYKFEAVENRACGFAIHNLAASWYVLTLAVAFTLFLFPEKGFMSRWMLVIIIAVLELGLFLTKSRAGIFSQIPMFVFLLTVTPGIRKKFIKAFSIFLAVFIFFFIAANFKNPMAFAKRVGVSLSSSASSEVTIGKRLGYWKNGIDGSMEATSGVGGMGIGGFKHSQSPVPHSHSVYFSVFHDFGFIGLALLAALIWAVARVFYKNFGMLASPDTFPRKALLGLCGGMVALGLHGLIEFFYNAPHIWLFLGLLMAAAGVLKRSEAGGLS